MSLPTFTVPQARDVTQMMAAVPVIKTQRPIQTNRAQFRMLERACKRSVAERLEERRPTRMQTFEQR